MLEDGGFSGAHFGGEVTFEPVTVERIFEEGDVIELGDIRLTAYEHPGHREAIFRSNWRRSEAASFVLPGLLAAPRRRTQTI